MQGDDLHQIGITFKAQLRRVATGFRVAQLVFQVAQQGAFALQTQTGGLQQVTQVQQVGQLAFALRAGGVALVEQPRGNGLLMQQLVQHRQEALALPDFLPAMKAFA